MVHGVTVRNDLVTKTTNKKVKFMSFSYEYVFIGLIFRPSHGFHEGSHLVLVVKNPLTNAGDIRDAGWIPGSGGCPGDGSGYLLSPGESHGQRSLVGYIVHRVAKSQT